MMIKDEQEMTISLDNSDTGQAHLKTWQREWKKPTDKNVRQLE